MPTPGGFIAAPAQVKVSVGLEPAQNAFVSLLSIWKKEYLSGMDMWVSQTFNAMPDDLIHRHRVVVNGLFYIAEPRQRYDSFEAYLDDLAASDPYALRDYLMTQYRCPWFNDSGEDIVEEPPSSEEILSSETAFLDYLNSRFCEDGIEEDIEREAYHLLLDPPAMLEFVVGHLRYMWETYLTDEWKAHVGMLTEVVDAFADVDLNGLSPEETLRKVTGEDVLDEHMTEIVGQMFDEARQVVFVPSPHIGPYKQKINGDGVSWVFFGARMPEGVRASTPDLDISEVLVRLNALADETRLRILMLVSEHGMLCTQDIMGMLDLTQSTAQRHLKQLAATGYLVSQRKDGAKCFTLNPTRIDSTLEAVRKLIQ